MRRDAKAPPADATPTSTNTSAATPAPDVSMPALLAALMAAMTPERQLSFLAMLAQAASAAQRNNDLIAQMTAMVAGDGGDAAAALLVAPGPAPTAPRCTVRRAYETFYRLKVKNKQKSEVTVTGRAAHLMAFICPDGTLLGEREIESLVLLDVTEYVAWRTEQTSDHTGRVTAPATRNREVSLLRRIINFAYEQGMTQSLPIRSWDDAFEDEKNIRKTTLDDEAFEKLLAACLTDLSSQSDHPQSKRQQELPPAMLHAIALVLYDTGMRAMECMQLQRALLNFQTGEYELRADDTKTGKARDIMLSPRALEAVAALPVHPTSPFLFCHVGDRFDGQPWNYRRIYKWFKRAIEVAGLKGAEGEAIWLHTLRSSFVRVVVVEENTNQRMSMRFAGHTTAAAHERYGFANKNDTRQAWTELHASRAAKRELRAAERRGPQPAHGREKNRAESTASGENAKIADNDEIPVDTYGLRRR